MDHRRINWVGIAALALALATAGANLVSTWTVNRSDVNASQVQRLEDVVERIDERSISNAAHLGILDNRVSGQAVDIKRLTEKLEVMNDNVIRIGASLGVHNLKKGQ